MEQLNMNQLLNRTNEEKIIKDALIHFEKNKSNLLTKRGIYLYGSPGSGKTEFINNIERLLYELSVKPEQIIDKWLNHCLHVNEKISFYENTKIIEGVFCGLDSNGFAKIEMNNKIKTYGSLSLI